MNALVLLAASLVSCPWSGSVRWSTCAPTVVYLPCTPTYVEYTVVPAPVCAPVAEVVAETQTPVVTQSVAATEEEKVEDPALAAVSAEEDIVTEPAGFSYGSALSLGHMALDWGVATIGSGTLMPTSGIMGFGGGSFPRGWNNGGDSGSSGGGGPPVIVNQITIVNNVGCPQPPTPIPEPAAVLTWAVLLGLSPLVIKRLRAPSRSPTPT